jgi:hypothetical protein
VSKPMLALLAFAIVALALVNVADANPNEVAQEATLWTATLKIAATAALSALVGGLVTAGLAVPVVAVRLGTLLGAQAEKISANSIAVTSALTLAQGAHDRINGHLEEHARKEFAN